MNSMTASERQQAHAQIIALVEEYVTGTHGPITHKAREYSVGHGNHRRKASEVVFLAPFDLDGTVHWVAFEAYLDNESRFTTETSVHRQIKTKRKHVQSPSSFAIGDRVLAKLHALASDDRLPFDMPVRIRCTLTEARLRTGGCP